jgi:hypothetical protein
LSILGVRKGARGGGDIGGELLAGKVRKRRDHQCHRENSRKSNIFPVKWSE